MTTSVCKAWSYPNSLVAFEVLFLISPLSAEILLHQHCKEISDTHTFVQTENNNHNIFLFFLLFSLFGNCRVNIFIFHITWHDAPKFTLSVYRNTLNITQGLTMDTRLTFCSLHLQQWMIFSRFLFDFFLLLPLTLITLQIISIKSKASWWSDKGMPRRFVCLVYKHNMYRNSTQTRYVSD